MSQHDDPRMYDQYHYLHPQELHYPPLPEQVTISYIYNAFPTLAKAIVVPIYCS